MNAPGSADVEATKQGLVKLMAIADRLDTRSRQTAQQLEASIAALDQGASRLSQGGDAFAQRALQVIGSTAQRTIAQGAEQAVGQLNQQLLQSANSAHGAAQVMEREGKSLTSARRTLMWNGLIALLIGSLLAAGGSAWIAHKSMREIARANFGKDILQATETGAITRCGDALCVRVGKKPRRYGAQGEYALLQ